MKRVSSRGLLLLGAILIAAGPALAGAIDRRDAHLLLYWLLPFCAVFDAARDSRFIQGSTLVTVVLLALFSLFALADGRDFLLQNWRPRWGGLLLFPILLAGVVLLRGMASGDLEEVAHWGRIWMGFHLFVAGLVAGQDASVREAPVVWVLVFGAALVMAGEWLTRRENPPTEADPAED